MTEAAKKYNLFELMEENVGTKEKPGFIITSFKSKKDKFDEIEAREMASRMVWQSFAEAKEDIVGIKLRTAIASFAISAFSVLTINVYNLPSLSATLCSLAGLAGLLYGFYSSVSAVGITNLPQYDANNKYLPNREASGNRGVYDLAEKKISMKVSKQLTLS